MKLSGDMHTGPIWMPKSDIYLKADQSNTKMLCIMYAYDSFSSPVTAPDPMPEDPTFYILNLIQINAYML